MARYFFNTADNRHEPDSEGTELADHAAARKHAIIYAGQIMHGEPNALWDGRDFVVDVTNDQALMLFRPTAYVTNAPAGGDTK
jgi:hypothetical protein